MSAVDRALDPARLKRLERASAKLHLFGQSLERLGPINRPCVAGDSGHCLACGAPQGEPCRQPSMRTRR